MQEEIFGPVLSIIRFHNNDEDEAVRIANNSIYSLASAVWTRDIDRAHRVSSRLHSGMVRNPDQTRGSCAHPLHISPGSAGRTVPPGRGSC